MFLNEIKKPDFETEEMGEGWSVTGAKIDYNCDTLCQGCEECDQLFVYILTTENGESLNVCKECAEWYTGQNLAVHYLDEKMNERFDNWDEHRPDL